MGRFISLIAVIFSFIAIACNAQPKIDIIGGDVFNWGKVTPKDSPLKAKVKVINSGNEALQITNVKPTCGCTASIIDKTDLKPGDTATLDVTLNIPSHSGKLSKAVRISSNDPNMPVKVLGLEAEVFNPLEVVPTQYFTFNEMRVGTESISTLKIKNSSEQDVMLSDFEISPADILINIKEKTIVKAGSEIELIARVKPEKAGNFNCSLVMKTNHPDYPQLRIDGYGNVIESPIYNNR